MRRLLLLFCAGTVATMTSVAQADDEHVHVRACESVFKHFIEGDWGYERLEVSHDGERKTVLIFQSVHVETGRVDGPMRFQCLFESADPADPPSLERLQRYVGDTEVDAQDQTAPMILDRANAHLRDYWP